MSRGEKLAELERLTQVMFEREQAAFRPLLAEEARLRAALVRLSDQSWAVKTDAPGAAMQRIGADVAWRQWSGQARHQLNEELARLRVRKEARIGALRTAFGKRRVGQHLREEHKKSLRRTRDQHLMDRLLEIELLSGVLAGDVDDQDLPDR